MIRFCEFCSTVHPDEITHCPDCGTRLDQTVSEEYFNDPSNPWPFVRVGHLQLLIQGKPRHVRFSGTHSVYHLWRDLHDAYENGTLYFREKGEEIEMYSEPEGPCPEGYQILDPVAILSSHHCRFSFHAYQDVDSELEVEEGELTPTYQGSFEILDCPQRYWRDILGWLVATKPYPEMDNHWVYFVS